MNFNSTKERIIYESLRLFSEKGFDGVSMREIAAAVDIKAASLYAHFKGKEAIYQAIVDTMKQRYNQETMLLHIDGSDAKADVSVYKNISMEQFKNPVLATEFSKQYYDEAISYQSKLFEMLAESGVFMLADYEVMAVQFFSPIYVMMTICDRQPQRESEMLNLLKRHIDQFAKIYEKK